MDIDDGYMAWDDDAVASDDMDAVLERSRLEHQAAQFKSKSKRAANGSSTTTNLSQNPASSSSAGPAASSAPLRGRIADLDAQISSFRADITDLQNRMNACVQQRAQLMAELDRSTRQRANGSAQTNGNRGAVRSGGTDYATQVFEWSDALKTRMLEIFGIEDFRLAQRGACNANMDRRDIICIMPTGGGKSLTYQLPALMSPGCTLVISPLLSLMADQIMHLEQAGVEAAMLTGATSKSEKNQIMQSLRDLADRKGIGEREIKLVYVTPEKMSKDKAFRALLQRLDSADKLARIVIDEAHCVSQLGHDFRPDYKELHILRTQFPHVPIMALSATCGPAVLKDLIKILGLSAVVDGTCAPSTGTVYFASPLYRKNLHYRVVPKPDRGDDHIIAMRDYILEHHAEDSGIIYCFSVKDTESVAEKLHAESGGRLKTGVYHARIQDKEKRDLHLAWRAGKVKIVCATIAFGLGIDKGDVRFVLHHSISKSLEGLYQESGRAGRDGKDADCVLYYRPQDATALAGLTAGERDSSRKLHAVLDFAEDLKKCRKIQFAEYFSHSAQLAVDSWSTAETGALEPCGHCDNCTRKPESIDRARDVTLQAWQIIKIIESVNAEGAKLTMGQLVALARGGRGGAYELKKRGKGRGKARGTETLDLEAVAGGRVEMSKSDLEHLVVHLLTQDHLKEEYQQTAYNCNVYLALGPLAARLKYLARADAIAGSRIKIEFNFLIPPVKTRKKKAAADRDGAEATQKVPSKRSAKGKAKDAGTTTGKGKGKETMVIDSDDGDLSSIDFVDDGDDDDDNDDGVPIVTDYVQPRRTSGIADDGMSESDAIEDADWETPLQPPAKRQKKDDGFTVVKEGAKEVMVLDDSSD